MRHFTVLHAGITTARIAARQGAGVWECELAEPERLLALGAIAVSQPPDGAVPPDVQAVLATVTKSASQNAPRSGDAAILRLIERLRAGEKPASQLNRLNEAVLSQIADELGINAPAETRRGKIAQLLDWNPGAK